jgi:glycosyltransferase involved in cell wall biosynthesis
LRAAIERLLNEPETCERLGRNARRFVVEHCSRPVFAARFAAALRSFARPN